MIARAVILLVLIAALAICLVFLFRSLHPKKDPATTAKTESETEESLEESTEESGESEPDYASISVAEMPEAANYKSDDKQYSMALAAKLAAMYDYDTAIAVLQGYTGAADDPDIKEYIGRYTNAKASLVPVNTDTVPHIFYHSLVNDYRGFSIELQGDMVAKGNNCWMTTAEEFNTINQQMYDAGCVLIKLRDLAKETKAEDGTVSFTPNDSLLLPEGKKAVIMSEDDLSYYHSYDGQGFASKLIVDTDGVVKNEYTDENGLKHIGSYDVPTLLEDFIQQHPDFSYHNAHCIIALTGYNGVLGYRTDESYVTGKDYAGHDISSEKKAFLAANPDYDLETERAEAKKVADAMKAQGFEFCSHTWGHMRAGSSSLETLTNDQKAFRENVVPVVGDVDTIIFAHGEDIGDWHDYSMENEKFKMYKSEGYNFFCNVDGSTPYWIQIRDNYVRTGRVDLDGYRLYQAMVGEEHSVADCNAVGIHDIDSFFSSWRPTPVELRG